MCIRDRILGDIIEKHMSPSPNPTYCHTAKAPTLTTSPATPIVIPAPVKVAISDAQFRC